MTAATRQPARPPTPTQRRRERPDGWTIAARLLWAAYRWRLELALVVILAVVLLLLPPIAAVIVTATIVYITRQPLGRALYAARLKRKWTRAAIHSGSADPPPLRSRRPTTFNGPRCTRVQSVAAGDQLTVQVGRGQSVANLEKHRDELAACLHVREVRVTRDPHDAGAAQVLLVRRDPLYGAAPIPWPHPERPSVWDGFPAGVDENGNTVTIPFFENHVLVGGLTRAGKSVFLRQPLAVCALSHDPVRLWLFDAKLVELAPWAPIAAEFVDDDGPRAVKVLDQLLQIVKERQRALLANGRDKIHRGDRDPVTGEVLPFHIIVVDELAHYAAMDEGKEIQAKLRTIASLGGALGVHVCGATQKAEGRIIDTNLRDQLPTAVCFRTANRQHADTILGQQGNAEIANALAAMPKVDGTRGIAYMQMEDGNYERFKAFNLTRDDCLRIVEQAISERAHELTPTPDATIPQTVPDDPDPTDLDQLVDEHVEAWEQERGEQDLLDHLNAMWDTPTHPDGPTHRPPHTPPETRERSFRTQLVTILDIVDDGQGLTHTDLERQLGVKQVKFAGDLYDLRKEGVIRRWTGKPGAARKGNPWLYRLVRGDQQ